MGNCRRFFRESTGASHAGYNLHRQHQSRRRRVAVAAHDRELQLTVRTLQHGRPGRGRATWIAIRPQQGTHGQQQSDCRSRIFCTKHWWRLGCEHWKPQQIFSIKSWPFFYEQAYEALQPGGWVENQEFDLTFACDDGTLPSDAACSRWVDLWNFGIEKFGLVGRCLPEKMADQMRNAGFINVQIVPRKMPIGTWPRDPDLRQSGLFSLVGMLEGLSGLSQRVFTKALGWSVEEMELLLMDVRRELKNRRIHTYFPIYVVYGQKPPLTR